MLAALGLGLLPGLSAVRRSAGGAETLRGSREVREPNRSPSIQVWGLFEAAGDGGIAAAAPGSQAVLHDPPSHPPDLRSEKVWFL